MKSSGSEARSDFWVSIGNISRNLTKKPVIQIAVLVLLLLFILMRSGRSGFLPEAPDNSSEDFNVIRLHVIANSDSPEDQALKYKVRDGILDKFSEMFKSADSLRASRLLIKNNIKSIEKLAEDIVVENGFKYGVNAKLGVYSFPPKMYGDIIYPPGDYEALKVVIGSGEGANWWCVMFPPLCFVDISDGGTGKQEKVSDSGGQSKESESETKPETESRENNNSDSAEENSSPEKSDSPEDSCSPEKSGDPRENGNSGESGSPKVSCNVEDEPEVKYTFIVVKWWNAFVAKIRQWF